ncbi:hypothetical protein O181_115839 [Austropuccinia psidii MF-1]|uniref:Uncharacterized protein n=1 Tax=Austropuccinia psidii MF-1 TaxID=1389203 RepID=A0A9Q3PVZ1_9BASI|nr:hypothetical protein [Austropuccinia psidii MF-1]
MSCIQERNHVEQAAMLQQDLVDGFVDDSSRNHSPGRIPLNVEHTSHSGLTPNPVTSTNIGSPVPSTENPHHQNPPSTIQKLVKTTQDPPASTRTHERGPSASLCVEGGGFTSPGHP